MPNPLSPASELQQCCGPPAARAKRGGRCAPQTSGFPLVTPQHAAPSGAEAERGISVDVTLQVSGEGKQHCWGDEETERVTQHGKV